MAAEIDKYGDWLKSEIDIVQKYHNHKETMAWTVTAFYLPGVLGFSYLARIVNSNLWNGVNCLFLLLLTMAVLCFVNMQYKKRFEAADETAGLRRAMVKLLLNNHILPADLERDKGKDFPRFVENEIDNYRQENVKRTFKAFLIALPKFFSLRWNGIDPRIRTELSSYCAIIFVTMAALVLVWIK